MKKSLLISGIVAVLLLVSFKPDDWIKYTSEEGKYSISFPDEPRVTQKNDTADGGVVLKMYQASYAPSDNEVYKVCFIDMHDKYPVNKTLVQILNDSRDRTVKSMHATNVVTDGTSLGHDAFVEFTFQVKHLIGKARIYMIDTCQYSLIKMYARGVGTDDADKFIGSFRCPR